VFVQACHQSFHLGVFFPLSAFVQACSQSFHVGVFSSKLCSCKHALKAFTLVFFFLLVFLQACSQIFHFGCVFL
jgi:hypothetical protein